MLEVPKGLGCADGKKNEKHAGMAEVFAKCAVRENRVRL